MYPPSGFSMHLHTSATFARCPTCISLARLRASVSARIDCRITCALIAPPSPAPDLLASNSAVVGQLALSQHSPHFVPGVVHPADQSRVRSIDLEALWPVWLPLELISVSRFVDSCNAQQAHISCSESFLRWGARTRLVRRSGCHSAAECVDAKPRHECHVQEAPLETMSCSLICC